MTLDGFVTLWLVQPAAEHRQTCCFVSGLFWCLFWCLFLRLWCLRLASVSLRPAAAREAMNAPPPWGRPVARCAWIASSQRATRRPPRWRLFLAAASRSPHGASKAVSAPPPRSRVVARRERTAASRRAKSSNLLSSMLPSSTGPRVRIAASRPMGHHPDRRVSAPHCALYRRVELAQARCP